MSKLGSFSVDGTPIGARVQKALWKYIHRYRPEPAHPAILNLFLSQRGYPLSADRIYRMIRAYGEKAGLQGVRCSPHTFRHTFAKKFLLNGGDLFTLQKILGHSSLDVVRLYLNLSPKEVEMQHRKLTLAETNVLTEVELANQIECFLR